MNLGPHLLDLCIKADALKVPLNNFSESLTRLESLTFLSMPIFHRASVSSALSELYFSSATLKSITIDGRSPRPDILRPLSMPSSAPSSLCHLDLSDFLIPFDNPIILSRLGNLTSLKFSHLRSHPEYAPDAMWTALKSSGIQLEELVLGENTMTASLVDYLSSFSGLKKLRLNLICSTAPKAAAALFWSTTIPKHADTLEDFGVFAAEEGEWCFLPHNQSSFVRCTQLEFLGLSIANRRSEEDELPRQIFLDNTVSVPDDLELQKLSGPSPESCH